jgi:hypothetical protein
MLQCMHGYGGKDLKHFTNRILLCPQGVHFKLQSTQKNTFKFVIIIWKLGSNQVCQAVWIDKYTGNFVRDGPDGYYSI